MPAVMGRLRRWHLRKPTSRAGARRAGLTGLALLGVTAGLAVLLAALFHLGVAVIVVAILGSLPALYLAWAAVPGAIGPPERGTSETSAYGRPVKRWPPADLGVHQVIGGGPMPTYIPRPHDEVLRAVLDPTVAASRLVVVRSGSSTGKTRAAYEAVADRLPDWRLDYPLDSVALAARQEARIPARTVLWLGELRHYADGGPAVLGRLADLLEGDGHIVITTMWREHWNTYIDTARSRPGTADPAGTVGRLLERLPELTPNAIDPIDPARGGVIDVPEEFTCREIGAAVRTGDPVLAEAVKAAAAAGQDGQITQYLAGVPDLLRRYEGPSGDPYGQAVITAAMDAARIGHAGPLTTTLLLKAAVGYLTDTERTQDIATWGGTALAWASEKLKGAVRALYPVPPPMGTGVAGYRVADYLEEYGQRTRQDQLGPPSLWQALAAHTASSGDLYRIAAAAADRGLLRYAATAWTTAAASGHAEAAGQLIRLLRLGNRNEVVHAARWIVGHASLDSPWAVAELLRAMREVGAGDAVSALASRAAAQARLDDPLAVAELLRAMREVEAGDAVSALASRAAAQARLDDPPAVAELLRAMNEVEASDAVSALASRAAAQVRLDTPSAVAKLLWAMNAVGASEAVSALASRAVAEASVDEVEVIARLPSLMGGERGVEVDDAIRAVLQRSPVGRTSLDDPRPVAELVQALLNVSDAVTTLVARAVDYIGLADWKVVAWLLRMLFTAGASEAVTGLASQAAERVRLDDPEGVAELLGQLRDVGADDAVRVLLERNPVGQVRPDDPRAMAELLRAMHEVRASDAVTSLASRAAGQVRLDDPEGVAELLGQLRDVGADDAVRVLLERNPVGQVRPDDPGAMAELLRAMHEVRASDAVTSLASRAAGQVRLDDLQAVAGLLRVLHEVGAGDAVSALASRAAGQVRLDDTKGVAELVRALQAIRAEDDVMALVARVSFDDRALVTELVSALIEDRASKAISGLAARAISDTSLVDPVVAAELMRILRQAGASDPVAVMTCRVKLDDPWAVAMLMRSLPEARADDALRILLKRGLVDHVRVNDPRTVGLLLWLLWRASAAHAVAALAVRAAADASVDNPADVAVLLQVLCEARAGDAVTTLALRAAAHTRLDFSLEVPNLLQALRNAEVSDAVAVLADRAANAGLFDVFLVAHVAETPGFVFGREPDGSPSHPWQWQEPAT
jgi:hypothetical protein